MLGVTGNFVPLQTVARFLDLPNADVARSSLESAGLSPRLLDEQIAGLDWGYIPALGGLRLAVPQEEVEEALAILGGSLDRSEGEATREEAEHLSAARRRKRNIGFVAFFLAAGPFAVLFFVLLALSQPARKPTA